MIKYRVTEELSEICYRKPVAFLSLLLSSIDLSRSFKIQDYKTCQLAKATEDTKKQDKVHSSVLEYNTH